MLKEYAFGLHNRHHFGKPEDATTWECIAQDTFVSLWDYDEHVVEFVKEKKTLANYDGLLFMPDEFLLDVDGENPKKAQEKAIALGLLLEDYNIPYQPYFSGRGFHFGIHSKAFRWKPDKNLHVKVKEALLNKDIWSFADSSVSDKTRIIRLVNSLNSKSKLWKIPLTVAELQGNIDTILLMAKKPRKKFAYTELECEPVFDALNVKIKKSGNTTELLGSNPDPSHYTCIQKMVAGINPEDKRHPAALRIASHLRWRYPESVVRLIMEDWRQRHDTVEDRKFSSDEMDKIVTSCYKGHNGEGYNYGCSDFMKDKFCSSSCKLFKAKKSTTQMDAKAMEKFVVEYFTSGASKRGINLGHTYEGVDFPIRPGEVVMIQAPPKSMKTMLLLNWINAFKRPTYMLEGEMSPLQIWIRNVMIETGWTEEQIAEHYSEYRNGLEDKFDWLTVDYNMGYPQELGKRIQMLPKKPEIVVVDHMGLFKSKLNDPNMRVEEASQALVDVARNNNVIIFVISEVSKSAFHEGLDIASSKGSFRVAYNVNKVVSLEPRYMKGTKTMRGLRVYSTANREKEEFDCELRLEGVRLDKVG